MFDNFRMSVYLTIHSGLWLRQNQIDKLYLETKAMCHLTISW